MKVQILQKFWCCAMFLLVGSAVAAAQNAGEAPAVSQPQSLAVDWRQRGVAGSLNVDDTQAMNQAVLEQKQAGGGGEFNWPNHFLTRVSAAINAANTGDLTFRGTGPTSGLVYCGDGTHPVFDLDRAHTIEIRELSIFGHWRDNCTRTYARAGIAWDQARAGAWTASNLLVDRVFISPAPQGDIATPDFTCIDISAKSQVNVEDGKFYNIVCHPGGGIGFHIGPSFNPKNEVFFNNNVSFGKYGYQFDSGSWHIQYGEVGNFSVGLKIAGWTDPVSIDGLLSEANRQFLSIGTGPILHPITLSHINNGWDDKATAPCFWDIGGARFALIFSNSWGQSNVASPHHVCGNGHSSAIFLNNGFAWKSYGSNYSTQNAQFHLPPEEMKQLLGASYGFYGGGNILLGTAQQGQYFNNGVSFINSSGGTRRGFRYSADNTAKESGTLPAAADHIFIGDGVIEIGGPGAPSFVLPGCAVTGKDFSVPYSIFLFALDPGKRRSSESHTFCNGPETLDASHTVSFAWEPTPEAASYDVVVIFSTRGGQACFAGNTTAASMTLSSPLNCSYKFPLQNEAEYIKTRGRGIWGFGPANETTPTWSIDTASGNASFSGVVNVAKLQGIADTSVVANLNADRVDGKHASDFTAAPVAAPVSARSPCTPAQWAFDRNFVYLCVATDTWRRAALSSW